MRRITYRCAGPEDAEQLLEYLKTVGGETDNLTFGSQGIPFTLEQERSFLEKSQNDLAPEPDIAEAGNGSLVEEAHRGSQAKGSYATRAPQPLPSQN